MIRFPDHWRRLRVTLVHDWLTGMRGGERVLEVLCEGFPQAPILTLLHRPAAVSPRINAHRIRTSWLQYVPGVMRHYHYFLPLFPGAIASLRVPPSDLILSTSHCVAKGVRGGPRTPHLCYCFTPMRYAWVHQETYFRDRPVLRTLAKPILRSLRSWDRRVSHRVDHFLAISRHVRERIRQCYGREADVVYPPVDTDRWALGPPGHQGYDLVVSALVPYKRIDLAIRAYRQIQYPLKIIGVGTEEKRLRALADERIAFLGRVPDEAVLQAYRGCRHLVFPGEEDFGLVPLEAQACGKPVVAFGKGGVLESVVENRTGVFFFPQTEEALIDAVHRASRLPWDPLAIRSHAERFHPQGFVEMLAEHIARLL